MRSEITHSNKPASPLRKTLQIVVGVLWSLFVAEMFLRIFAPVPMLPRYIRASDYGIRDNVPNATYEHNTPDYTITIRTNSKGIRADREIPYTKPKGVSASWSSETLLPWAPPSQSLFWRK